MRLAEQLKYYRELHNETQESLAMKLDVTRQSISKWETGACFPDIKTLVKLSTIYQVSLDEIIKGRRFFSLPFDVGVRYTRARLVKHFLIFMLIASPIISMFASIFSNPEAIPYKSLFPILFVSTIILYIFFFTPFSQKFNLWQVRKDGLFVYDLTYLNQIKSFFLILTTGSNLSLYHLIPYQTIEYTQIIFKKKIMNPKQDYSVYLISGPRPFTGRLAAEPFYVKVKTQDTVYFLDLGNDYTFRSGNAYFFLPEIKELFDQNNVVLKDPQEFVEHSKKGILVYDFVYEKEEEQMRNLSKHHN